MVNSLTKLTTKESTIQCLCTSNVNYIMWYAQTKRTDVKTKPKTKQKVQLLTTYPVVLVGRQEGHPACKKYVGWWRWALVSPDGVAPSQMVSVSASVNLPLHHKVHKFSSGTGSPGWSRKKGRKTVVWRCDSKADTDRLTFSSKFRVLELSK